MSAECCADCGKNHAEEIVEALPEMYLLDKAFRWAQTKEAEEIFSDAVQRYFINEVRANREHMIRKLTSEGSTTVDAVDGFAVNMALVAFSIGVSVAEEYRNMIPAIEIDSQDRDRYVEEYKEALKVAQENLNNQPVFDKSKILELLKEAGIVPQDFDGEINVDAIELPSASAGGDDPPTGMYL